jgi:hypothetical protein
MSSLDLTRKVFEFGPLLFGIGFIAPLIAQSLDAASISAPFGLSPIQFGLAIAIPMGTVAKLRGRWI